MSSPPKGVDTEVFPLVNNYNAVNQAYFMPQIGDVLSNPDSARANFIQRQVDTFLWPPIQHYRGLTRSTSRPIPEASRPCPGT